MSQPSFFGGFMRNMAGGLEEDSWAPCSLYADRTVLSIRSAFSKQNMIPEALWKGMQTPMPCQEYPLS